MPDCTSSRMPYGSSIRSSAPILSDVPVASTVSASGETSTTLARKSWTVSRTWLRTVLSARTFTSSSSRCTAVDCSSSTILITLTSLLSCLVTCSSGSSSTATTIVMRDTSGFSVGPTARDSMLNPRRENRPETRASTPGLFSTSTLSVWTLISALTFPGGFRGGLGRLHRNLVVVEQRPDAPDRHDLVVAGAGGDHRPHLGILPHDEVDHDGTVVDLHRAADGGVDVFLRLAAQPGAAQRFGQQHEVRDAVLVRAEVGVGVPLRVEEVLPLPDHAQVAVVDDGDLDRRALDGAGGQLLVGHLEAAIAVDRPHGLVRDAELRAHRGGHRVAHGAEAAGVDPGARVLVLDELRGPHLVLADAGGVHRVRADELPDPLDDVLRRQRTVVRPLVTGRVVGAPAVRLGPPVGEVGLAAVLELRRHRGDQLADDLLAVAHDRDVGLAVLGDLGRVDVGVHDRGVRRERRQLAGDPVVEPG